MKAHFLVVLDSHADSNGTKEALDELGLQQGEDYLIIDSNMTEAKQIFEGKKGERLVDAINLLVFTGLFNPGGSMNLAVQFAASVRSCNLAPRIFLRSSFGVDDQKVNPVFDGQVKKECRQHPNLQAIIKREFGL